MKKLKLLLLSLLFFGAYAFADVSPMNLKASNITNNAFHQKDFLIGEYLDFLNPKKWVSTNLNILTQNIYFSSCSQSQIFKLENAQKPNPFIPKEFLSKEAIINKIEGLKATFYQSYNDAVPAFLLSSNQFSTLKDSDEVAVVSYNLSKLYFLNGDFNSAINYLNICKNHFSKSTKGLSLNDILLWKAQVFLALGAPKSTESLILNNILSTKHSKYQEQQCYYILGKAYYKLKQYTQAKWFFIQADELARKLNSPLRRSQSLLWLAKVKNTIKDHYLASTDLLIVKNLLPNVPSRYKLDLFLESAQTYAYLHNQNKSSVNRQNFELIKKQFLNK